jgi:hypothetical protein
MGHDSNFQEFISQCHEDREYGFHKKISFCLSFYITLLSELIILCKFKHLKYWFTLERYFDPEAVQNQFIDHHRENRHCNIFIVLKQREYKNIFSASTIIALVQRDRTEYNFITVVSGVIFQHS